MWRLLVVFFPLVFFTGCMTLPSGVSVLVTDNPEPYCVTRNNCYHVATRTIVMVPNQSLRVLAHEGCHAHQHRTVLDELGVEPKRDLQEWYDTTEAAEYAAVVDGAGPNAWGPHYATLLEDFAEACGRYMVNDERWPSEPLRAAFFAERDFR